MIEFMCCNVNFIEMAFGYIQLSSRVHQRYIFRYSNSGRVVLPIDMKFNGKSNSVQFS